MNISEIAKPFWTLALVDHMTDYGARCYALSQIDIDNLPKLRRRVANGEKIALMPEVKHFAIHVCGEQVGLISLGSLFDGASQLHICIYGSYQGKGYGKHALREFLAHRNRQSPIEAVVGETNPRRHSVITLLESCGFREDGDGNVWLHSSSCAP